MTQQLASSFESDTVDALLRDLRVASTVYCRSTLTAPWGFGVRGRGLAAFHVITRGDCWLEVDGEGDARLLHAGDLVILPRGTMHWLRDAPDSPTLWLEDLLARHPVDPDLRMHGGGGGPPTDLLCGAFAIDGSAQHPVLSAVPTVIHHSGSGGRAVPWIVATFELIAAEATTAVAGASVICERLSEVMLAQALRAALIELQSSESLNLELLRDSGIAPAVRAIHERPEHAWTLGELSHLAAMSRSAFAARFRAVTGDSPIRYVKRCRLARAARDLRATQASVAQVALSAGYESEYSFSRAFKRGFGVPPRQLPKRQRNTCTRAGSGSKPRHRREVIRHAVSGESPPHHRTDRVGSQGDMFWRDEFPMMVAWAFG